MLAGGAQAVAEISTSALESNLAALRSWIGPGTALWPVVKADAYGLGLERLWPLLAESSDGLCVATAAEALELRAWGYAGPALVLMPPTGLAEPERSGIAGALVRRRLELMVSSWDDVAVLVEAGRDVGGPDAADGAGIRLHLLVDTGMNRGGVRLEGAAELLERLRAEPGIDLTGIASHFATADTDPVFAREQLGRFRSWLEAHGPWDGVARHMANSAGVLAFGDAHLDLVRPGLATYGYLPAPELGRLPESADAGESGDVSPRPALRPALGPVLRPALRLVSRLLLIKEVRAGESTGYGRDHVFRSDSRVGVVPLGYADGLSRSLAPALAVRVRGRMAPVRGAISMDQLVVDLSEVPEASVGDEVVVLDPDPEAANAVEAVARAAGTIPYEILTRLGPRIERRLVD